MSRVLGLLDRPAVRAAVVIAALLVVANQQREIGGAQHQIRAAGRSLAALVRAESLQRVHTIGERCETTDHQAKVLAHNLPPGHLAEAKWFTTSHQRCLVSLRKVERRAGVHYTP